MGVLLSKIAVMAMLAFFVVLPVLLIRALWRLGSKK